MTMQCRIGVALPPLLESQLRAAGFAQHLVPLRLEQNGAAPPPDLVVLDPLIAASPTEGEALSGAIAALQVPCLFYTISAPRALHAVVGLQHLDPVRVLIKGVDDTTNEIRTAVAEALRRGETATLRRALAAALAELPPTLQFALDLALRRPEQFFDAADIARHAGFSRRHVDRVLHHQGLAPAKQWVIAARVWHALHLQRAGRMTSADAASRLGYADPKALRRHREIVLGRQPPAGRPADDRDVTLMQIQRYLTSPDLHETSAAS